MRRSGLYAARPVEVVELSAAECHPLRRQVLRDADPDAVVTFPEDDRAGAFHLGARDGGVLLGVASFAPSPTDLAPGRDAWQLRGMAVTTARQRTGAGRAILAAAFDRLRAAGAEVLWANARDSALPFYERLGMTVEGDGFMAGPKGTIPHHVVRIDL